MSQGGGKNSQADIAREYMIAHAQQVVARAWQCGRCGTANESGAESCAQCGGDGQGASRIPQATQPDTQPVLVVTMNDIPGYRITEVHGDAFGLVVRARNYFSNLGAQLMTVAGGEVTGYTRLLTDSRNQAHERMWREAHTRGSQCCRRDALRLQRDRRHHVRGGSVRDRGDGGATRRPLAPRHTPADDGGVIVSGLCRHLISTTTQAPVSPRNVGVNR